MHFIAVDSFEVEVKLNSEQTSESLNLASCFKGPVCKI